MVRSAVHTQLEDEYKDGMDECAEVMRVAQCNNEAVGGRLTPSYTSSAVSGAHAGRFPRRSKWAGCVKSILGSSTICFRTGMVMRIGFEAGDLHEGDGGGWRLETAMKAYRAV